MSVLGLCRREESQGSKSLGLYPKTREVRMLPQAVNVSLCLTRYKVKVTHKS
jgi:hypothetical protein